MRACPSQQLVKKISKHLLIILKLKKDPLIEQKENEIESRHCDTEIKATAGTNIARVFEAGMIGYVCLAGPHAAVIVFLDLGGGGGQQHQFV